MIAKVDYQHLPSFSFGGVGSVWDIEGFAHDHHCFRGGIVLSHFISWSRNT